MLFLAKTVLGDCRCQKLIKKRLLLCHYNCKTDISTPQCVLSVLMTPADIYWILCMHHCTSTVLHCFVQYCTASTSTLVPPRAILSQLTLSYGSSPHSSHCILCLSVICIPSLC